MNPDQQDAYLEYLQAKRQIQPRAVPDLLEPLIGYRVWRVQFRDEVVSPPFIAHWAPDISLPIKAVVKQVPYRLQSFKDTIWQPYEALEATHAPDRPRLDAKGLVRPPCHESPCEGHIPLSAPMCGIYAFRTIEDLAMALLGTDGEDASPFAIGTVKLWGRFARHAWGYRAQFAYPATLVYGHRCDAAALARIYGIPYEENQSWKSVLKSDADLLNPSTDQYQYGNISISRRALQARRMVTTPKPTIVMRPFPVVPILPMVPVFTNPSAFLSTSLHSPSSLALVRRVEPKPPRIAPLAQPSFNLHKPVHWFYDQARALWLRVWDEIEPRGRCSFCGLPKRECRRLARRHQLGVVAHTARTP